MNRKTWVGLIVGVAVVVVLAFAVWTQNNPGPPKLKALAGMKPAFRGLLNGMQAEVYTFRSETAAIRKSLPVDLESLGFSHLYSRSGVSEWLHAKWIVSVIDGEFGRDAVSGWGYYANRDPKSPDDPLCITVTPIPEPTLLDRLKFWLGL